ncbi:hypothetical protein [Asanoa iriomotensis]|nr:hypothetical protein [Asanoa iriomotensis]
MDWVPLLSAIAGAAIALSGSLLAEVRRDRGQRRRDRDQEEWQTCVDFGLALDSAHSALRDVAASGDAAAANRSAANSAVHDAGVFAIRERMLMSAGTDLATAGERAFLRVVQVRNVVREGATLQSAEYHGAYHAFAEALWSYRVAVRTAFGRSPLTPAVVDRASWSEVESCDRCSLATS